jgi:AhpD family alkylhydroperoxidase
MESTLNTTPNGFAIHTISSAPEGSRDTLQQVEAMFGGVLPNLFGVLADSPEVLSANIALHTLQAKFSLTPTEIQIIDLAISHANSCGYCTAAHSFLSRRLPEQADLSAARNGQPISDPKLAVLREFAVALAERAGHLEDELLQRFLAVGYNRRQALEVSVAVGFKSIQNFVNNLADTPIDPIFA